MVMAIKRKICYAHKQHNDGVSERERARVNLKWMSRAWEIACEKQSKYLNYFLSDMSLGLLG